MRNSIPIFVLLYNYLLKVLFLIPYPSGTAASQRFRFEQYLPYLKEKGIEYEVSSFWDEKAWQILYKKGGAIQKALGTIRGLLRRYSLIFTAHKYDRIFIHRELYPVGPQIMEWVLAKVYKKRIIFDFDDAIWLPNYAVNNAKFAFVKSYGHVKKLCKYSWKVSAGNKYLADYAKQLNANVVVNPTTIDTEHLHNQVKDQNSKEFVIGWTGTHSTLRYLEVLIPIFKKLEQEFNFTLSIISDRPPNFELKSLKFIKWNKSTEIDDLLSFNVGLMPLTLDKWANGKCGFKALQYMSLGIPAIVSPVGVNTEIVDHCVNGFVCDTPEEWETTLRNLLANREMVVAVAENSRKKIIDNYSVLSNKQNFINLFE